MNNPKKKPAILISRFPYEAAWGGEEHHTLLLASYLRDKGFEVIFFGNCPVLTELFHNRGFRTVNVKGGRMIVTPLQLAKSFVTFPLIKRNMVKAFRDLTQEYKVKALYCLSLNEKLFLTQTAVEAGIPVTWVEHQQIRNWLMKSPWKKLYVKNSNDVRVVPVSMGNHKSLLRLGVKEEKIIPIINGVDAGTLTALHRKTEKGLIIAANRFISKKGLTDFLEAIEILGKEMKGLSAVVIGEGPEEDKLEDLVKRRLTDMDVKIMPPLHRKNWYEYLSRTDVYVSCARDANETFSLNTAEALAAGCKVVVTRCSGVADYLEDEKEAFLAEAANPQDLAEKIKKALSAPEHMRNTARESARIKFDQKKMLEQYEGLLLRR